MNNSIEIIKEIYKPYKYTYKGSALIIETTSGNFVIKKGSSELNKLFSYLKSRSFYNFPKIIDESRKEVNMFEYQEDFDYPKEQKANDLIRLVAKLHYKTAYYKDVTEDKYKEIYENIKSNIDYYNELYDKYYDEFYKEIYMCPSHYLYMRNYSKIKANLKFCEDELNNWYELVKNNKNTRVSVVHNNLELDHYIKNDNEYLISWEKYIVDTPVIDLVTFYKREYFDLNFENLIKTYQNNFNLSNDELKLFLILISIPNEINFDKDEFISCLNLRKELDYIYKTENLIRPYYLKDEKKE